MHTPAFHSWISISNNMARWVMGEGCAMTGANIAASGGIGGPYSGSELKLNDLPR